MSDSFLSIAGIRLRLRTERPLAANASFAPFLTEPGQADVSAEFVCVDTLPDIPRCEIRRDSVCRVFERDNGSEIRFYYASPDAPEPYGAGWETAPGQLRVAYLPEGRQFLSEFGNTFYHLGFEKILIGFGRLYFHAACVETSLGGILFSGPSGIGKSTQAGLWCRYRDARQINGDRPALSFDGENWLAWGMPYAGSSRVYVNACCCIRAIVMLRQDRVCTLRRMGIGEAFRSIWSGLTVHTRDKGFVDTASRLAMELAGAVPVYEFACTPDEEAVAFLEQQLRKDITL